MPKAKSLKTQTVYDPMQNVVSSAATQKKSDYPAVNLAPAEAAKLDTYFALSEQIKSLEGEKDACYNDVKSAAFESLVDSHFAGNHSNIRINGLKSSALFICQNKGKAFGLAEKQAFEKTWGSDAALALLEVDNSKVKINTDVWDSNKDVLIKALNAVDSTGARIVPETVVQRLFSVSLKVTSKAIDEAGHFADTRDKLAALYRDLGLVTSLRG